MKKKNNYRSGPQGGGGVHSFFLSINTGSLIHEHYTRECEFGNFDKIKKPKKTQKSKTTKKTFG